MLNRALLIAGFGLAAHYGAAQTAPNATCQAGFEWSFNSLGQSPCDVAAFLGGVCINGPFTLPPITAGLQYFGPPVANANPCRCSSVYYSLLSACAECQLDEFIGWTLYKTNCTTVYSQVFPERIPPYTKVPHWAFLDVTVGDTFNPTLAESAGGTESTSLPSPSGGPLTPNSPASGAKKSNTGAIAGGVVGGIIVIALIAGSIFWFLRRKRQSAVIKTDIDPVFTSQNTLNTSTTFPTTTPSPFRPYDSNSTPTASPFRPYDSNSTTTASPFRPYDSNSTTTASPFRPYDPNDPSTYPNSTYPTNNPNSNAQMTYNPYNHSQPVQQMVSTAPSHPGIPEV